LEQDQIVNVKGAVGFRYTPALLLAVGVLIVTEYAFVYLDAALPEHVD